MRPAPVLLEAVDLAVRAGARLLIGGLNLQIRAGEFWCLLGVNGAGKTLLLQTLAGARPPAAGTVSIAGRPLAAWDAAELARQRGLMTQSGHDAFATPALDLVLQGLHPHLSRWQWEGPAERKLACAALARVGLAGLEDRDVGTLSGGERQRVALATLLAQDPPLMLLDEPLAHLDLAQQVRIAELLADEARSGRRGVLMSVHDLNLAQRVASHVILLGPATVLAGPVDNVMSEAALTAAFGHSLRSHCIEGRRWWLPV